MNSFYDNVTTSVALAMLNTKILTFCTPNTKKAKTIAYQMSLSLSLSLSFRPPWLML